MKKFYLILGNITFHHFTDEEMKHFKTDSERKALVHDVVSITVFNNENDAGEYGENALGDTAESYLVIGSYTGEYAFENKKDARRFNSVVKFNEK